MKPLSLSKEIREGKLNDLQIIKCLDIHHNQVLVSAISQIAESSVTKRLFLNLLTLANLETRM